MSHVSISRSYAVLVGLEAYVNTRRRGKKFAQKLIHGRDRVISPEAAAKREEGNRDKSEGTERERHFLEAKRKEQEKGREEHKENMKLLNKFHRSPNNPTHGGST